MIVKAPAVAKLFGEHAVVYGRLSVAAALDVFANAEITDSEGNALEIVLSQMGIRESFSKEQLKELFYGYAFRNDIKEFCSLHNSISEHMLPYCTIAGRLMFGYGINVLGKRVVISSEIPMKKGFASSAACSTAFTVALLKHEGVSLPEGEIIEIARDGDRILHRSEGAGKIDVSTSFYGGYVSYSSMRGVRKEPINSSISIVFIDTGPKKSTAETVGHVAELYNNSKEYVERIFDMIEECSTKGLEALQKGDIAVAGSLMFKNHELLDKLGVSSKGLNEAVEHARKHGAYGAKLSGGGGGGMAIAVHSKPNELLSAFGSTSFQTSVHNVVMNGARSSIDGLLNSTYSR
ncbi:MAG: mevalonate kinase [Candidatus Micrarchaeia archaeon]